MGGRVPIDSPPGTNCGPCGSPRASRRKLPSGPSAAWKEAARQGPEIFLRVFEDCPLSCGMTSTEAFYFLVASGPGRHTPPPWAPWGRHTSALEGDIMKLRKKDLAKIVGFSAALAILAVGIVVTCAEQSATPQPPAAEAAVAETPPTLAADQPAQPDPSEPEPCQPVPPEPAAEPAPPPVPAQTPAAPAPRPAPARAVPAASLPPFMLPSTDGGGTATRPLGPAPGVLWLSGVIQGDPTVAVLRRGENRYHVCEGDLIEGRYRVISISNNTAVLQRGSTRQTLRVGQY